MIPSTLIWCRLDVLPLQKQMIPPGLIWSTHRNRVPDGIRQKLTLHASPCLSRRKHAYTVLRTAYYPIFSLLRWVKSSMAEAGSGIARSVSHPFRGSSGEGPFSASSRRPIGRIRAPRHTQNERKELQVRSTLERAMPIGVEEKREKTKKVGKKVDSTRSKNFKS